MLKITDLTPNKVFEFFEQISSIPRGSGNTSAVAEYCIEFAKKRKLRAVRDNAGNVVIYADGTKGYEYSEPVILQGHLDMVCEKTADCNIDMAVQGPRLCTDGEYVRADGTTLGGDNGIAVAYILALLDSPNIPHPPIEALLTTDEEIGMIGARELDASLLRGKRLINIDSEEEGVLTVSCAGGVRAYCSLPLNFADSDNNETAYRIDVSGLLGGHSGIDINKHRKNAHLLMGRLLNHIAGTVNFTVADIGGGKKTNVIPQHAFAVLCTAKENGKDLVHSVEEFSSIISNELAFTEPQVSISCKACTLPKEHTDSGSTRTLIFTLQQIPNGIQSMSPDIPDMVQTSLNMGKLSLAEHNLKMGYLIRSNASTGKQLVVQKLQSFVDYLYGTVVFKNDYPVWEYRAESPLRNNMINAFKEVYGNAPKITSIHAGLECGILSGKIKDIDLISFGPDIENVHTPNERMNVASVERCWNLLVKVLEKCI